MLSKIRDNLVYILLGISSALFGLVMFLIRRSANKSRKLDSDMKNLDIKAAEIRGEIKKVKKSMEEPVPDLKSDEVIDFWKNRLKCFVLLLCMSQSSFAVTVLKEGESAPYDGYLFSESEEKQVRQITVNHDKLLTLTDLQHKEIETLHKKDELNTDKISSLERSGWQKYLYFAGGVLFSGLAVWGASRISK